MSVLCVFAWVYVCAGGGVGRWVGGWVGEWVGGWMGG